MDDTQLAAALQAEYLQLQKTIEDFDGRILTIKAWSVTFGMAALAGAFASDAAAVLPVASVAALLFWTLEMQWKFFQMGYYARSTAIERHFSGAEALDHPFQIGHAWYRSWLNLASASDEPRRNRRQRARRILQVALWPHVMLPHACVAVTGAVLFGLAITEHILM